MKWILLAIAVLMIGCSPSGRAIEDPTPTSTPPASTSTVVPAPTSAPTTRIELSEDEQAIASARQVVLEDGVMGADFPTSSAASVVDQDETIVVTLVPADPNIIGATAIIIIRKSDLSVVSVDYYR
jgi:hypothetical protein